VDFPEKAAQSRKFINEQEASFITARIQIDRQDVVVEPFHLGTYVRGAVDLKIWGFAALFGFTTVNTYAISYFLPLMWVLLPIMSLYCLTLCIVSGTALDSLSQPLNA
jgi:hypothetical protein